MPFCVDEVGFKEHQRKMNMYTTENSTARLANITVEIISLAMSGEIDKKFLNKRSYVLCSSLCDYRNDCEYKNEDE